MTEFTIVHYKQFSLSFSSILMNILTERPPHPKFVEGCKDVLDFPDRKMAVDLSHCHFKMDLLGFNIFKVEGIFRFKQQ